MARPASPSTEPRTPAITWRGAYSLEQREAMIREAAYYLAQRRGFAPGHDLEDWLTAETAIGGDRGEAAAAAPAVAPQQSGVHGASEDEELKRILKQHPQRAIPQVESVEPREAPPRE